MDRFHEGDAALQVGTEIRMCVAVLNGWARADAICKDGFELVEIGPPNVLELIYNKIS